MEIFSIIKDYVMPNFATKNLMKGRQSMGIEKIKAHLAGHRWMTIA